MKKRIISYLLVIAMVLACMPTVVLAAENALQVSVDSIEGDETVTVTYGIPNSVNIAMLELKITFDNTKLEATEIVWNSITGFSAFVGSAPSEANTNGFFAGSCNSTNFEDVTVVEGQTLVTATFKIKDGADAGDAIFTVGELVVVNKANNDQSSAAGMAANETAQVTVGSAGNGNENQDTTTYNLYYELTTAADSTGTALTATSNGYYVADPGAIVYAHIYLKSSATKTLQGYDFFITNNANLTRGDGIAYSVGKGGLVSNGTDASTATLTHIQYINNDLEVNLPADTAVEIAVIPYTVNNSVKYADTLDITIAAPTGSENAIAVDGSALSYNPAIGTDVKGIEITKTVTVTFAAGDGTGTMTPQTVNYNTETALNANTFTNPGYSFNGWSDGTTTYTDEQSVTLTSDLALTAQWKANEYIVSFNAGTGTLPEGTSATTTVTYDSAYGELPTPTDPEGYKFVGWYTNVNDETTQIEANDTVKITDNTTLTAKYAPITYTVMFDLNGGEGEAPESTTATYDQTIELPAEPSRTNYKFLGWNTGSTANAGLTGDALKNLANTQGAEVTLYAIWSLNAFDVAFNSNGGTAVEKQTVTLGGKATEPTVSKTGFALVGWYYTDSGTEKAWNFASDTVSKAITLTAKWTANTYTVKFVGGDGAEGSMADQTFTYNEEAKALTKNTFTKTGYTFAGWSGSDGENYTDEQEVQNLTADANGEITLTAQWTANTYTVKFESNGGSGTMNDQNFTYGTAQALSENTFTKTGYTFAGWSGSDGETYTDEQEVQNLTAEANGTVTLTAQWEVVNYTITYYIDGVEIDDLNPATYTVEAAVSLPTPTKAFYTFDGWYADANCTGDKVTEIAKGSTENKTFYAKWTARYKLEDYAYARTGDQLLIIDAAALESGMVPVIGDEQMYYYNADSNYGYSAVYLYIVTTSSFDIGDVETAEKDNNREIVKTLGDVNGNEKTDLGDANAVYQMLSKGGDYYTYKQVSILGRLIADMATKTTGATYRGTSDDAIAIVNILNGVSNN